MENTNKLFKVTLKGMTHSSIGVEYGVSYVVALDSDKAYQKVKKFLDENDIGYKRDRELSKIELIAEEHQYTDVGNMLFLS